MVTGKSISESYKVKYFFAAADLNITYNNIRLNSELLWSTSEKILKAKLLLLMSLKHVWEWG
jgi:hypothetical protein